MARAKKPNYDVGYGKPPPHTQFAKGQSGNLAGRPKGSKNLDTQFIEEVNAPIPIIENGKRRMTSKLNATIKQVVSKAASGDPRAAEKVLDRVQGIEARSETAPRSIEFTDADREVIAAIYARLNVTKKDVP